MRYVSWKLLFFPCKPTFHFLTGSCFPCLLRKLSCFHASWKTKLSRACPSGASLQSPFLTPIRSPDPDVCQTSLFHSQMACRVRATWHGANPPPFYIDHLGCDTILDTAFAWLCSGAEQGSRGDLSDVHHQPRLSQGDKALFCPPGKKGRQVRNKAWQWLTKG